MEVEAIGMTDLRGTVAFGVASMGSFLSVFLLKVFELVEDFSFIIKSSKKTHWNESVMKKDIFLANFKIKGFLCRGNINHSEQKHDYYNNDYRRV